MARISMSNTEEAIQTFADAFAQLSSDQYHELYVEALECIVRMAKAEGAQEARLALDDGEEVCITLEIEPVTLH
jgi:hypothetical protein